MIRPDFRASMSGRNSFVRWTSDTMLTCIISISVASSVSTNFPPKPNPALLISMSIAKESARTASTIFRGASGFAKSATMTFVEM